MNTLFLIAGLLAALGILYGVCRKFKPVARMSQLGFSLVRVVFMSLSDIIEEALSPDDVVPKNIFLGLGTLLGSADVFGMLVSLGLISPEAAASVSDLGALFIISLACQFAVPAFLLGALILDTHGYTKSAMRLFPVETTSRGFKFYIYSTLALSIFSGCVFYLAKSVYLYAQQVQSDPQNLLAADPTGLMHHLTGIYPILILVSLTLIGVTTLVTLPVGGYCIFCGLEEIKRIIVLIVTGCLSCAGALIATCQMWFYPKDTLPDPMEDRISLSQITRILVHVRETKGLTATHPLDKEADTPALPAPGSEAAPDKLNVLAAPSDVAGKEEELLKKPEKRGMKRRWGFFSEAIPLTPTPANPDLVNGNSNNGHDNSQNGTSTASPPISDELPVTNGMKHAEVVEPDLLFSAQERQIIDCMSRGLPINQIMTEVYGITKPGSDYQKKLPELRAVMQKIAQYASNKMASN